MTIIIIDDKTLGDLECILDNYFNPLKTFMNKSDWESVCSELHLKNGDFFPLPINLSIPNIVNVGEILYLADTTNYIYASLKVTDIYLPDIDWECMNAYGTIDINHPYVKYKQEHKGWYYVSGDLTKLNDFKHYDFLEYRKTPLEVKEYLLSLNVPVVGFQTRNPMHKAHFELTKYALKETENNDSVLLLNPVVGETQSVDIDYHIRVKCYKELLKYYEGKVIFCLLPLSMRMAGPREACLHALIRKNYGCTHFIVGRDHAGPSSQTKEGNSFYGPYDAQDLLFKHYQEIGINPITSKLIVYNNTKSLYEPINNVEEGDEVLNISGTELRRMLKNGENIPEWFSFPEVVSILENTTKKRGTCYYFMGLPSSGKTTLANMLKVKLLEDNPSLEITILDGDIVRTFLSKGLGFSKADRSINVRRIGYVASEIVKHNGIVICANICPYDEDRLFNRNLIENTGGTYKEIFVNTPLEICEKRDVKGLYEKARKGIIKEFTGISDPFEIPTNSDFVIETEEYDIRNLL